MRCANVSINKKQKVEFSLVLICNYGPRWRFHGVHFWHYIAVQGVMIRGLIVKCCLCVLVSERIIIFQKSELIRQPCGLIIVGNAD